MFSLRKSLASLFALCILIFSSHAFSLENIISPCPGVWSNLQTLSLNLTDDVKEIYYSIDGQDPFQKGFLYKKEVLLPVRGKINLKLTVFFKDGKKENFEESFTVKEFSSYKKGDPKRIFLDELEKEKVYTLRPGQILNIPKDFKYCFGKDIHFLKEADSLELSKENFLTQKVNLILSDGINNFSYPINICPQENDFFEEESFPFKITNWEKITFTDLTNVYFLDEEKLNLSGDENSIKVDRSTDHTITYFPSEKEGEEDCKKTFFLKAKVDFSITKKSAESLLLQLESDDENYFFCGQENNNKPYSIKNLPSKKLLLEIFPGQEIHFNEELKVYYSGLYQGTLNFTYSLDKRPAPNPEFISSVKERFSRNSVSLTIESPGAKDIYYSLSPSVSRSDNFYGLGQDYFEKIKDGDFKLYDGKEINLFSVNEQASYYRIRAYAQDENGNASNLESIDFIIDENNYYFNSSTKFKKDESFPLGTYQNPFTDFYDALKKLSNLSNVKLHVLSDLNLKNQNLVFTKDISLEGHNVKLTFDSASKITILNSSVKFKNFKIKGTLTPSNNKFIFLKNASLTFHGNELELTSSSNISSSLYAIYSQSSEVDVNNSFISIKGKDQAFALYAAKSKVSFVNSKVKAKAKKANVLFIKDSVAIMHSNKISLDAESGSCLSLEKCSAALSSNTFTLEKNIYGKNLSKEKNNLKAFTFDSSTNLVENSSNTAISFP